MNEDGEKLSLSEIRDKVEQVIAATDAAVRDGPPGRWEWAFGEWQQAGPNSRHLIPEVRKLGQDISALFDQRWSFELNNRKYRNLWRLRVKALRERARSLGVIE